jgi:UPF0271 protein
VPKIIILDTSALISGFVPGLSDVEQVTVQEVLDETRSLSTRLGLETAVISGKVKVVKPSSKAMEDVMKNVKKTGDSISETDAKLLAIAVDLKDRGAEIVTDDYAVQNLARVLEIPHRPVLTSGIKKVFKWELVCSACGRKYPVTESKCQVCGSDLLRRPKK